MHAFAFPDTMIYCTTKLNGLDKLTNTINLIGGKIFDVAVQGCYWFFAIISVTDIIKKGKDHDYMGCIKTALAGAGGFLAVKLTRFIMDLIKENL